MSRASWDDYFIDMAVAASTRATCDRLHVGAVIVVDRSVVATGYNGSTVGAPHCDDAGHELEHDHCVRTVHAEANAIAQAARRGARTEGATMYVTHAPCWPCFKLIVNAGIKRVIYKVSYKLDGRLLDAATAARVELRAHMSQRECPA